MCAQFETVNVDPTRVAEALRSRYVGSGVAWASRIVPHTPAPVVTWSQGERTLEAMRFSLVPAWSKEARPKFATYNARLSSYDEKTKREVPIYQKPTWREPFAKKHCLVPMTEFIEPSYTGPLAGNMLKFFRDGGLMLVAAGIWEEWKDKATGEIIDSFAIITDEPDPVVVNYGHDRMPLFLDEKAWDGWLEPKAATPKEFVEFLKANRAKVEFKVEKDRPLKAGWEKRAPK